MSEVPNLSASQRPPSKCRLLHQSPISPESSGRWHLLCVQFDAGGLTLCRTCTDQITTPTGEQGRLLNQRLQPPSGRRFDTASSPGRYTTSGQLAVPRNTLRVTTEAVNISTWKNPTWVAPPSVTDVHCQRGS